MGTGTAAPRNIGTAGRKNLNVVVVGGGLVGAAAALACAQQGWQVTLIEHAGTALELANSDGQSHWDLRISSVHQQNFEWLQQLGAIAQVSAQRLFPYTELSVTTAQADTLSFAAAEVGHSQLGYMIENNALQGALWRELQEHAQVTLHCPAQLLDIDWHERRLQVQVDGAKQLLGFDLLLGCDGSHSRVAAQAGVGYRGWDYGQRCLLANVTTQAPLPNATWEVFRPGGPYALLPLGRHQACLIDYRPSAMLKSLQQAGTAAIKKHLDAQFEAAIGPFELMTPNHFASFPIQRKRALRYHAHQSMALLGDAAHSIHPLAGQGVNLGFADIQGLIQALRQTTNLGEALVAYQQQRLSINQRMMRAMDAIHYGFGSQHLLPQVGLKAIFGVLRQAKPMRQRIIREAMGLG